MKGVDLKTYLRVNNITQEGASETLGVSRQTVNTWCKLDELDEDTISKIERKFKITQSDIVSNVKTFSLDNGKSNLYIVPLKAFGGFLTGYADTVFMEGLEKVSFPFIQGECFAFEVEDFSMVPDYAPSDYVVCTPVENFNWLRKGKVYVFQTIDGLLLKIFDKMDEKFMYLKSINADYNPVPPIKLKSIKKVYYKEYTIKK